MTQKIYETMSQPAKLYPDISEVLPSAPVTNNNFASRNLSDARMREIELKRNELQKDLKRYQKVLKRWKTIENTLKVTSVIIVSGTTVASIITGIGTFLSPIIVGVITGVGASETVLSNGLIFGLTKKRRHKYLQKIGLIKEYIDKSYLFFHKISEDGIITIEELRQFQELIKEYETKLNSIVTEDNEILKLKENLLNEAKEEAKSELKKQMKEDLKSELMEKYRHASQ